MSVQLLKMVVGRLRTNTYVLYHPPRGTGVIIDPGDEGGKILTAVSGITISHILLTHGHPDHLRAAKVLRDATRASLEMHPADAHLLKRYQEIEPNRTLAEGDIIQISEPTDSVDSTSADPIFLNVLATPGHSIGGICFYDRANQQLFCGDTLFEGHKGTTHYPGGSKTEMANSLARLRGLPPAVRIYPGHGRDFLVSELKL
jgi:glyoxylase-like metal-dependent hydrolase (beta-lactamase superfamily II)